MVQMSPRVAESEEAEVERDFGLAFKSGQKAFERAEKSHREIKAVFERLHNQVLEASGRRLSLRREGREKRRIRSPLEALVQRREENEALIARSNVVPDKQYELCRIHISKYGYPVELSLPFGERKCAERKGLEDALEELLREPLVAGSLWHLMRISNLKTLPLARAKRGTEDGSDSSVPTQPTPAPPVDEAFEEEAPSLEENARFLAMVRLEGKEGD